MSTEFEKMPLEEIAEAVASLLADGDLKGIKRALSPLHPSDVARLFEEFEGHEVVGVFKALPPETASEVLLELEGVTRELVLASVPADELTEVVAEMATDDATDVVGELADDAAKEVLGGIGWKESVTVQKLLKYPEDTAGGKMQAELVKVTDGSTVGGAIEEVRKVSEATENIACVFVVDSGGRLEGTVALDKLILAKDETPVKEIMKTEPIRVSTEVDQEEVARIFQRYDLLSLAVVDSEERLVGCITVDDIVDVIEEEIFEDFYRMASLNIGERALDPPGRSFGMRSPWLILNLGTAFVAASVVKVFESTIESFVILAVLMPVVANLGGNAATQTITVMIRGLALGELDLKDARRVLFKEAAVGFGNGLVVGAVAGIAAYILGASMMIGVLLFLAMTANLVIAGLSGATIPLILKRFKADPALSASIFVTACTDVGGFFTFLGLAALFIKVGLL